MSISTTTLQVRDISKSYAQRVILRGITFALNHGDRFGLVGANGAGKSTLLRVIASVEPADSGAIQLGPSVELGYLEQTPSFAPGQTIESLLAEAAGQLRQIEIQMRELEAVMAAPADDAMLGATLAEYGALTTRYQDLGGYDLEHRLAEMLAGLGLSSLPLDRQVEQLSGGERARIGLAALLLRAPGALLLDEPTSHLDDHAAAWLADYLRRYSGAALIVSHDRAFLNDSVTRILELDERERTLTEYVGDYDAYARVKATARVRWEEEYERQREEMTQLRSRMRESAQSTSHPRPVEQTRYTKMAYDAHGAAAQNRAARDIRNAAERLKRIEEHPIPKPPKTMRFTQVFRSDSPRTELLISAEGISKQLGGRTLLRPTDLIVTPEVRFTLVGPNGAGKTTLLRLLLGLLEPDTGSVRVASTARIGYLAQDPAPAAPGVSLLQAYRESYEGPDASFIAGLIGYGLFQLEDMETPVSALSLGQRRKLEIARLLAARPTVLALDEPSNYISLDLLEAFEQAIIAFPGPVLAVSHDRAFIRHFGADTLEVSDGALTRRTAEDYLAQSSAGA
jgi:macrolide transport system ATP-binding/permease protein